jgi:hypothetical protein
MTFHYTNRYKSYLFAFSSALLISACSSTDSTPGTEVHAHLTHLPAAAPEPDVSVNALSKTITLGNSDTIELTAAYLTISEMELRTSCAPGQPFARIMDTLYELLIPTANAHTESTPTLIGEPLVVNVLNPDTEELEFGHFSPPPASYCGITVHMHPADVDSRGLPSPDMTGKVIRLEGIYNGTATFPFLIEISDHLEHADIEFPAAIALSASNLSGEAHLNIEYNTWLNGLSATDIADLDAGTAAPGVVQTLAENIVHSLHHGH